MSKVWLITGSSRGLGRAFVEAVLDAGDRVVAAARRPEQLAESLSKEMEPLDVKVTIIEPGGLRTGFAGLN